MNNDIQIARFVASGNMSREDALHESESLRMAQAAKRQETKEKQDKRKEFAKDAAAKRQEEQKNTAEKLQQKLKSRRENLAQKTKEANKLRKQNPTLGDKLTKYKPKFSKMSRIGKDEGSVTATGKLAGNVAKAGANVAKGVVGAVAGARRLKSRMDGGNERDRAAMKAKAAKRMVDKAEAESIRSKTDSKSSKFAAPKPPEKKAEPKTKELPAAKKQKALPAAKPKQFGRDSDGSPSVGSLARSNKKIRRKLMQQREEFIQEVEDKKKEKIDKVIDIMKGKNTIKVNPDMKESTVIVQDAKGNDFVEIVDIISPEDVRSDWKKELGEGSLHKWFKGSKSKDGKAGWVNVKTGGTCASDEPGEGTPKCVSSSKRASMTKAERDSASRRKKAADPNQQQKSGAAKPTYVATDKKKVKEETQIDEKCWDGYTQKGMKKKGKKIVPNCVPVGGVKEHHTKDKDGKVIEHEDTTPSSVEEGIIDMVKKGAKRHSKAIEKKKIKNRKAVPYAALAAEHELEGEIIEAKVDKGRSDYGKASIRNYRRKGPGHGEPAMFDPENKRGKLIDKRREEHKARRGVKGAKVPAYKVEEVVTEEDKKGKGSGSKDACYKKVKASAKVWPSAYASGRLVQCRKKGAANYGNKSEGFSDWRTDLYGILDDRLVKYWRKDIIGEGAAWTKKAGKNKEGGLNEKGRKSYERENPGSDLKAPQPEGGSRKKSFCARMGGMKKKLTSSKTANDPDSRINKALRKWKC